MATKKKAAKAKTKTKTSTAARPAAKKAAAKKAAPAKKATPKAKASKPKPAAAANTVKKSSMTKTVDKKATGKKAAEKKAPAKKTAIRSSAAPTAAPRSGSASATGPVPGIAPYVEKKGEEYMNTEQVVHFRKILLAWKRELMEEVDRTVHHMQDEAANFPDPNDRATQESEFSMELRTRDRERKLIKKIDEAIGKLDAEDYGYCEACGVEIGIRRLEARPTATLCIDCKTLDEIRERQHG
jgi:RNA polymerase-binding transcription factor